MGNPKTFADALQRAFKVFRREPIQGRLFDKGDPRRVRQLDVPDEAVSIFHFEPQQLELPDFPRDPFFNYENSVRMERQALANAIAKREAAAAPVPPAGSGRPRLQFDINLEDVLKRIQERNQPK